jgi:O-acetyl-ADP-ribose deacetylase (regulator of RNase III)
MGVEEGRRVSGDEIARLLNGRVIVKVGDITQEDVDAVVNAANSTLMGGGGVDGAIHRAGGPEIKRECEAIRREQHPQGLPTGHAVMTTAGRMRARHVIHTVGPVYSKSSDKSALLAACYTNSLTIAAENALHSVAFPAISTGIYGYPREEAAAVASSAIETFLKENSTIEEVRLVFFQSSDAESFLAHQRFS